MFDIRLAIYTPEADTPRTDFWHTHAQVIVSLHTLRADHRGRHERLLDSDPWDLVLVDESHHITRMRKAGPTLALQLIKKLTDHNKVQSMVFFTGTPHRGKTFGFLAQLQLLRPDLFDPRKPLRGATRSLRERRDTQQQVQRNRPQGRSAVPGAPRRHGDQFLQRDRTTVLRHSDGVHSEGTRLRRKASPIRCQCGDAGLERDAEARFQFRCCHPPSDSWEAATNHGRKEEGGETIATMADYRNLLDEDAGDAVASAEEELARISSALVLMEDEEAALRNLLAIADRVESETKIARLLEIVAEKLQHRAVLFFTEYKADPVAANVGPPCNSSALAV
jgi:hypothetical protein